LKLRFQFLLKKILLFLNTVPDTFYRLTVNYILTNVAVFVSRQNGNYISICIITSDFQIMDKTVRCKCTAQKSRLSQNCCKLMF